MTAAPISPSAEARAKEDLAIFLDNQHFHPLEVFSFFRRWKRGFLRNLAYTVIFNAMFAVFFTLLALVFGNPSKVLSTLGQVFAQNLLISNVIGFSFVGVFAGLSPLLRIINRQSAWLVGLFYAVIGTVIVTGAFYAVAYMTGDTGMQRWVGSRNQLVSGFIIATIISIVLTLAWTRRSEELAAQISLAEERERTSAAERATTQANLRALQAQIEPHFLFNTLANVTSLIHSKPDDAKHMLEEFIAYLRASLANTREAEATLSQEFELMKSFLAILKIRMGDRLQTSVSLPTGLMGFHLPPMLVQPLVENAIKHGLEPKIEGGEICLSARQVGDVVEITVADTGLGFQNAMSNGIGLKNVRERLDKIYNGRATLSISDNAPCGTKITISLPTA